MEEQQLHDTMRAARVLGKDQKYTLTTVPKPKPGPGEIMIEVKAAGFCHTDMIVSQGFYGDVYPITGSHEAAGIVVELGEGVEGFMKDERVIMLNSRSSCGECWDCRHDQSLHCPKSVYSGINSDGCFADYFVGSALKTVKIPESMPWDQAAPMTCAGVTIYSAIRKADLKKGQVLAISGLGALGHIGVQISKALGYFTVGVDARDGPLDLCRTFKHAPDVLFNANQTSADQAKEIVQIQGIAAGLEKDRPLGVDALILTAESPAAIAYATTLLKPHGTLILVSQPDSIQISSRDLIFKDITVKGSLHGGPKELREVVELVQKEGIRVETRCWGFDEVGEMWKAQEQGLGVGKNVVLF